MTQTPITEEKEQTSLSLDPTVKAWLNQAAGAMTMKTGRKVSGSAIANGILKEAMIQAGDSQDLDKLQNFLQKKVLKRR
jgi:hypothetical protein